MDEVKRRVVCAALRYGNLLILGPRHFDLTMRKQISMHPAVSVDWSIAEQGFVDQLGRFLSRREAWRVAHRAGQIIRRVGGDGEELFSENLY